MKRRIHNFFTTLALFFLSLFLHAQEYKEFTDTKPHDNEAVWNKLKNDTYFVWGNTDTRYPKLSIPNKEGMQNKDGNATTITLTAWRGERVNAQALLYSKTALTDINFSASPLKDKNGTIAASAINIHPVRYVMTDELNKDGKGGCGHRPDATKFDSSIVADVLDKNTTDMQLAARTTQPAWINIWVPVDAKPGKYNATLSVNSKNKKTQKLNIELIVKDKSIATPSQWAFHLDLWQNPYAVARYHNVPLWSKEHFDIMRPLMKMLANAGQKIITATIMHKPWAGQTYDAFSSMVMRTKNLDGSWKFNYAVFDKWVSFMIDDVGIDQQINCYTMIPWALNFDYYDVASNSVQFLHAKPGSKEYADYWLPFLKDFAQHLKAKGWFNKTTIAMDERAMKDMQAAIKIIKEADPDFKVSLAGNYHPEIEANIYDYCIAFGQEFPAATKSQREKQGKISTVYTCCTEAFPNTFTFSPPADATWIGWHTAAGNYDGYLRWAYNSWTEEPLQDSRFRTWAGGDTYLVYPDARSSIRFERLIEGIQDFEKIKIIRKEFVNDPDKLKRLNDVISYFTIKGKGNQSTENMVRDARKILNSF